MNDEFSVIWAFGREKLIPTFLSSCMFWMPAQAVNFILIPNQVNNNVHWLTYSLTNYLWIRQYGILKQMYVRYFDLFKGSWIQHYGFWTRLNIY